MPAVFEVEVLLQHWGPPFEKKRESSEFRVEENEKFDVVNEKNTEKLFTLVRFTPERALVEYNRLYTLKGYEHPQNRQVWIDNGKSTEFSFLWGEHGLTKKLCYKGIGARLEEKKLAASAASADGV